MSLSFVMYVLSFLLRGIEPPFHIVVPLLFSSSPLNDLRIRNGSVRLKMHRELLVLPSASLSGVRYHKSLALIPYSRFDRILTSQSIETQATRSKGDVGELPKYLVSWISFVCSVSRRACNQSLIKCQVSEILPFSLAPAIHYASLRLIDAMWACVRH